MPMTRKRPPALAARRQRHDLRSFSKRPVLVTIPATRAERARQPERRVELPEPQPDRAGRRTRQHHELGAIGRRQLARRDRRLQHPVEHVRAG